MTITIERSEEIMNRIADADPSEFSDMPSFFKRLEVEFPDATDDDIIECFVDSAKELQSRAEKHRREMDALHDLRPLFEGMPEGMALGDCAFIKAEQGDPLALAFIEWEKKHAGGVQ